MRIVIPGAIPHGLGQNARKHWREKAKITAEYRRDVEYHALNILRAGGMPVGCWEHSRVTLTLRVCTAVPKTGTADWYARQGGYRPRDPLNFLDACKPLMDGLVDAGVLADDTWAHIELGRVRREIVDSFADEAVVVDIEPVEEGTDGEDRA